MMVPKVTLKMWCMGVLILGGGYANVLGRCASRVRQTEQKIWIEGRGYGLQKNLAPICLIINR
jgi:hypothetical protein